MSQARWLAMAGLATLFFATLATQAAGRQGLVVAPPRVVQPYKLIDQNAQEVLFPSGNGIWQLVVFGYTHCPDVCPMTLHKTTQLLKELGAESARLRVVFISIDSARDDTKAMKDFVGEIRRPYHRSHRRTGDAAGRCQRVWCIDAALSGQNRTCLYNGALIITLFA